jgi:hypothetical protein
MVEEAALGQVSLPWFSPSNYRPLPPPVLRVYRHHRRHDQVLGHLAYLRPQDQVAQCHATQITSSSVIRSTWITRS